MRRKMSLIFDIFEEFGLWLTLPLLSFFHKEYKIESKNKPGQPNVIIVERWLYKNIFRKRMIDQLRKKGLNVYGFFDHLQDGTYDDSADRLNEFIAKKKLQNITFVGISSGGITCLSYLKKYDWKSVDSLISIGTPFYGTPATYLLFFIPSARKMLPGSSFLQDLAEKTKNKDRIYCARATFDLLIPSKSAVIKGSREIIIHVIGHNNLHALNRETYTIIERIIKNSSI